MSFDSITSTQAGADRLENLPVEFKVGIGPWEFDMRVWPHRGDKPSPDAIRSNDGRGWIEISNCKSID
jgi:hypothetical protein